MFKNFFGLALLFLSLAFLSVVSAADEKELKIKGIYLTQYNLENTAFLKYLIKNAKEAGIDTFVVDLEKPSKRYQQNIALLKENNIRYVARIIMFPNGAAGYVLKEPSLWQKKYPLVQQAIDWGASQIQLDYIRYSASRKASPDNALNVWNIIKWYKNKIVGQNIPLQVDVFGVTSFGESKHIGQNIKLFSQSVDAICPMVYPSHYWPYQYYSKRPYETVYDSLTRIKKQFGEPMPIKVYAFIEMSNFHYLNMSRDKIIDYIKAQINAVDHANVNGWYAWSAHNRYENLFTLLKGKPTTKFGEKETVTKDSKQPSQENLAQSKEVAKGSSMVKDQKDNGKDSKASPQGDAIQAKEITKESEPQKVKNDNSNKPKEVIAKASEVLLKEINKD